MSIKSTIFCGALLGGGRKWFESLAGLVLLILALLAAEAHSPALGQSETRAKGGTA